MIRTNAIQLSERTYFEMLFVKYLRQRVWWLVLMIALAVVRLYSHHWDAFSYVVVALPVIFVTYAFLYFRNFAYSRENKVITLSRYYEIDDDLLVGFMEDGTQSQIKLQHFVKTYQTKEYALAYLSRMSFVYLPKDAFQSPTEFDQAMSWIERKMTH